MKNQIKACFLILNLMIAIIAFNFIVSADMGDGQDEDNTDIPGTDDTDIDTGDDISIDDSDVSDDTGGGDDTGGDIDIPPGPPGPGGPGGGAVVGNINLQGLISKVGFLSGLGSSLGGMVTNDEEGSKYGAIAGVVGGVVAGLSEPLGEPWSTMLGVGVGAAVFIFIYKKDVYEVVEFYCLPWKAPVGGDDCEICNDFKECSEYTCRSLGQACGIVNEGTQEQKCVWIHPHDVNSPKIEITEVNENHIWKPDNSLRPPATGVVIERENQKCIKAFTPLEFSFKTNEPAQCKIDYNLTKGYENMSFFVGGSNLLLYNHTEKLSLPGPDALNDIAPELQNDGEYTLFIRCRDANGNFNQDAYSVNFCVEKGPDTTPPRIVDLSIPSGNPVQYNKTEINLEVYVNEPSECKWSRQNIDFENMEGEMKCSNQVWQMNSKNLYTCEAALTGIKDREINNYYFKCKDQPFKPEADRNINVESYLYKIIGTQPLNIINVEPDKSESIVSSTNVVPVFLEIQTDNGYDNGNSICYYYNDKNNEKPVNSEDYIEFVETDSNSHKQRQDLPAGNYVYYFKCVDLGGNTDYNSTSFSVYTDRKPPIVVRTYKEGSDLKIITNEKGECSYSNNNCNFEIEDGIQMISIERGVHTAEWNKNKNYYIRCKDEYNNQPNPNTCSIILRPYEEYESQGGVIEL